MIPAFYTSRPEWAGKVERIMELFGRVSAIEEFSGRTPELRRSNRIGSVHSSTAIEGNQLSLQEVEGIAEGQPVFGPQQDVAEVSNALQAYAALDGFDPWNVDDFLKAHRLLTMGLVNDPGTFRTVDVEIVGIKGQVLHTGSRHKKVRRLVSELFEWASTSEDHPLIVSSAVHFLIEHIHPFRDGNGRIGRLWQTLILSRWRPIFGWMPTETLVRQNQAGYYRALQDSREPEIDAASFIDYMLDIITESLRAYEAKATANSTDVVINDVKNVVISDAVLELIRSDSTLSAAAMAERVGKSPRTIQRALRELREGGLIRREGSNRAGRWIVIEGNA